MRRLRFTRRRSQEEKKNFQQLILSIAGIICLLFLFLYVGLPFLIKVSGFIAGFKKESILTQNESKIILEPVLDPLPVATNSARISISGSVSPGETVILYINKEKEGEKITGKDGVFVFNNVSLEKGVNDVYAIAKVNDKESSPSKTVTIIYKNEPPQLEIEKPQNEEVFKKENKEIEIKGRTDEDTTVFVNDRLIIVNPDGDFSTFYQLQDGENKLEVKAVDLAGNTQKVALTVFYEP